MINYGKDKINYIRTIANENIEVVFDKLGVIVNDRGPYFNGRCPIHLGDNGTAFSFLKDTGIWKCWTKGCHVKFGTDIFSLVRAIENVDFTTAVGFVENLFSLDKTKFEDVVEKVKNASFAKHILEQIKKNDYYNEEGIKTLVEHPYLINRGFSKEVCRKYQTGFCLDHTHPFFDRYVLPIRDENNGLVGFTGRYIHDERINDKNPKWKHEGRVHNYLFNYNFAQEYIKESQFAIISEGPLGCLRLEQAGINNSVSIMGLSLSKKQERILLESGCFSITIALDNDPAGNDAFLRLKNILDKYFYVYKLDLGKHKDIDEISPTELKEIVEGQHSCITK